MKGYIAEHKGMYLPGFSLIIAPNDVSARIKLNELLKQYNLETDNNYIKLKEIDILLNGDPVKYKLDIDQLQTPANRISHISYEQKYTTSTPTKTHRDSYAIAKAEIGTIKKKAEGIYNVDIKQLEDQLIKSGTPYTPGRGYEIKN